MRAEFIELFKSLTSAQKAVLRHEMVERALGESTALYRALRAENDPLTGLPRRDREKEFFQEIYGTAQRENGLIVVAIADIDHFKRVNDTFGHEAGDVALKHLATVFKTALRYDDHLTRHGGEEFLLMAKIVRSNGAGNGSAPHESGREKESPTDDLFAAAVCLLERLQRVPAQTPLTYEGKKIALTISIGAYIANPADLAAPDLNAMLKRADSALYRAKESGRNCVITDVHESLSAVIAHKSPKGPSRVVRKKRRARATDPAYS